ncbi:unnamed protein product [Cuscuta campestris]|uniref:At1g61320/AtMIF1 LRR domain-containing protein n=1 Tax=Cuscuta campestris TaxID=132261 RepID=A0A484KS69_9ASTE|nr:unnamed protein product [Cuscuta campestris]
MTRRDCLFFDLSSMFKIGSLERTKCVCSEYKSRFVSAVSKFIVSYRGTRINTFAFRFCLINEYPHAVFHWIRFAFDLGVEMLDMEFHCECFTPQVPLSSIPWKIPIELSPRGQPVLKSLLLSNCDVATTFTLCPFIQLEDLRFHHLRLKSHFMWSVLSGLVNLKHLEMKECELRPYLSLNSLTSLEGLWVTHCVGLEKIDMANLKLKTLSVLCRSTVSLGLTGAPNLNALSYAVHDGGLRHIFSHLPETLPHLSSLRVVSFSSWMEHMPESIATFSRLRTLTLALDHGVGDMMFRIVQLLDSCPLLYGLSIVLSTREDKEHEKLESIDEYYNHHEHLEWIEIRGFVGTKYQIESCKCLLKLAPRAKSMILTFPLPALLSPATEAGHRSHPLNKEERRSAVNALKAVSNDVKVFFI